MQHISLFSGIGGFELAAEWMGWQNIASCEINEFGNKVLNYYWPDAYHHDDIHTFTYEKLNYEMQQRHGMVWRTNDIILTGGFPCQPYSAAGKRLGKEDDRHLWPEMLRIIREVKPTWIVGENVYGLVNWNDGLVFEEVQADLEAEGYEVQPYILPAASVNAPHKRNRIWFIAIAIDTNPKGKGLQNGITNRASQNEAKNRTRVGNRSKRLRSNGHATNTHNQGLQRGKINGGIGSIGQECNEQPTRHIPPDWENFPTQSPLHRRDDGLPKKLAKFVVKELQNEISKTSQKNRIENLSKVREKIQSPKIWKAIRGLYSLESQEILLQTMQLYSTRGTNQVELSPFSEKVSRPILRTLQKHGEFASTSQGRELEKQRFKKYSDTLQFLPHEVALAARRFETQLRKFEAWHRNESIKAAGNAIVPQVALQIFKAIEQYQQLNT